MINDEKAASVVIYDLFTPFRGWLVACCVLYFNPEGRLDWKKLQGHKISRLTCQQKKNKLFLRPGMKQIHNSESSKASLNVWLSVLDMTDSLYNLLSEGMHAY